MKYKYYTLLTFLSFSLFLSAQQVPNGGFETWTNPKAPDGWYTFSSGTTIINLASKDTTSKTEGNASASIQSATISGSTTYEILSLGTADHSIFSGYTYIPVYFPFRPDTLFFAYTYSSPGTDTATAYIKLSKGDSTLVESQLDLVQNAQWSFPFIVLTSLYANAETPDSLLIQFQSSKVRSNFFGVDGSTLHVDEVHFGYVNRASSISAMNQYFRSVVFPNPFMDQLSFVRPDNEQTTVLLYNFLGQQVWHQSFTKSAIINTAQLADGIYFYELRNFSGFVEKGKLVKQ